MEFIGFTSTGGYALSEGSIFERLRRDPHLPADPQIFHSSLIYEVGFADALEKIHRSYWDIAQRHYLPMLAFSDTWRANRERIEKSRFNTRSVNQDNIRFLQAIRSSYGSLAAPIFIAGQIGPYGNAYRPAEALPSQEAQAFHTWQINALAEMGPDLLYAATLPAFFEAIEIAYSMSKTGLPYVLSFVVRPTGTLLDGSTLANAMEQIDNQIYPPPTGYAVNCVHPRIFLEALKNLAAQNEAMLSRILSFQANAADLTPEALDNQENLLGDEPSELADLMKQVHEAYHVPFLGGCCGTDERLITALADLITLRRNGTQPEE